jgi:hypothetical protein
MVFDSSYLLGLLAMIKCSICSYQCDNWYTSDWRFHCHNNFSRGGLLSQLAGRTSPVAQASHFCLAWQTHWVNNKLALKSGESQVEVVVRWP